VLSAAKRIGTTVKSTTTAWGISGRRADPRRARSRISA